MQKKLDIQAYEATIKTCKCAREHICFGLEVSNAILNDVLKPEHLEFDKGCYWKTIEWNKNIEVFKEQAEWLSFACFSFAVILFCETYFDLYEGKTVDPNEESDLYSAQMILRIVRNSMGHVSANSSEMVQMRWNVEKKEYRRPYKVKEINMELDATDLNGQIFKLDPLGGMVNFLNLLNYLEKNLIDETSKIKE